MHWRLLLLLLLLGWCQLEVLTKLAQVVHVTSDDDLALGLWRRRLLHLLLLLLGSLVDVWRRQSNVVRRHDDLLGLKLLLLLLLLVVGHHRWWRHVSCVVWMSHVHRRFAHRLHLNSGTSTTLLWPQRWRRFSVVWRRARILPHGTLRHRLSVTIYIHATAAAAGTVGHFSSTITVHLVDVRVIIYNRRLAMLLLLLLMGLMLNVAANVRRLIRVHRVLGRASVLLLLIALWNLLLLLRRHRHILIVVALVGRSLWAQWLLLWRLLLLLLRHRLLRLRLLLLLWRLLLLLLLLWWSSSVVG